jgi:glutamate N-acetyltransferase/amino-acid N-acetyltransferase
VTRWDRWITWPDGTEHLGDESLAPGFKAGVAAAGIKTGGRNDVGLLLAETPAEVSSAIFLTSNAVAAAPVRLCRERCESDGLAAVMVNSGNANAATGEQGFANALALQQRAAQEVGIAEDQVAVAETGVIGVQLDMPPLLDAVGRAAAEMSADRASEFAEAIMTTDAGPKQVAARCEGVTLTAQAKGAGMIEPGFATMLCFVQTDGVVADLESLARASVASSFERITVDGQMSTNDTVLVQSSGISGNSLPTGLLEAAMLSLALEVVADGEGATRIGRIDVRGAKDAAEAERVAREIANSPLVKTALHGRDPKWGRILQATGAALAGEDLGNLGAEAVSADELGDERADAEIAVELSRGNAAAHAYFSDLTNRYVEINSEYTT